MFLNSSVLVLILWLFWCPSGIGSVLASIEIESYRNGLEVQSLNWKRTARRDFKQFDPESVTALDEVTGLQGAKGYEPGGLTYFLFDTAVPKELTEKNVLFLSPDDLDETKFVSATGLVGFSPAERVGNKIKPMYDGRVFLRERRAVGFVVYSDAPLRPWKYEPISEDQKKLVNKTLKLGKVDEGIQVWIQKTRYLVVLATLSGYKCALLFELNSDRVKKLKVVNYESEDGTIW